MLSSKIIAVSSLAAALAACSSSSPMTTAPAGYGGPSAASSPSPKVSTDAEAEDAGPATAVIGGLAITTIGSTVDPTNGDQNRYGPAIPPGSAGLLTAGDLVVCNFNDSANVQGNGTTIEILHPTPGSTPARMVQDPNLKGCAALAIAGNEAPWAAAYSSNLAPFYGPTGTLVSTLSAGPWAGPLGEAYAPLRFGGSGLVRDLERHERHHCSRQLRRHRVHDYRHGFRAQRRGGAWKLLGASGLTYDAASDTLFVVDSNMNRVVAFAHYSTLATNAIVLKSDGTFSGPSAASASVLFSGAPLNAPISAAQLFNGDLVVGNTADNLLVEISLAGKVVATQNLDTGAVGALFGIVATGTDASSTKIYFNEDNDKTVKVLSH
jgi:hypothetical protein